MSRSTCHAQRPEVSCREVLKLGNNKKDEERRKCIAPITNYQHLSTIIWYVWNGMKIHRAWVETCGKSQPSETSDQTQIISDPFPVAVTAIHWIHGPMAGWDDFTDLRRGKLTQAPAWWQIGEELRTTSLYIWLFIIYIYIMYIVLMVYGVYGYIHIVINGYTKNL